MDIKDIAKKLTRAGLTHRDAQLAMIQDVFDALQKNKILCIEAPTGTGKTLSYCIGSHFAKSKKNTIVISTATIALQEQLVKKDLPLLETILNEKINITLAKGRRRYVCHARVFKSDWQSELFDDNKNLSHIQSQLEKHLWNGDRDELDIHIPNQEWQKISTDSAGCTGKLCEFYEDCAFIKARKKIHTADIVVANHSLLLSDLELGGGAILPEPEKCIYIIDECHHLPSKALDHFACSATVMGNVDWINQLTKTLTKALQEKKITDKTQENINTKTHELVQTLTHVRDFLDLNSKQFEDKQWRIKKIPEELLTLGKSVFKQAAEVMADCELILSNLEEHNKTKNLSPQDKDEAGKFIASLGFVVSRAKNVVETWALFCHPRKEKEAPIARWFEERDDAYLCHTSPINVSQQLKETFWDRAENGAILCSATVRALGKFDDFTRKAGLKNNDHYREKSVGSFFDYSKSLLFVPQMKSTPSGMNQDAHRDECIELLPQLILPKTGTLVLFTSRYSMEKIFDRMPNHIAKDILLQTSSNKNKLIEQHKNRIRNGKRSILFGLASFGEGLDLTADFCQHVIIHKLPFAVPSTPIEVTRNEWIESNGMNAFMLSALPAASIRLTQYAGRLIRQETDVGIVTILDKRLYSKGYGKQLLNNLPEFERLINEEVATLKAHKNAAQFYDVAVVA